MFSLRNFFYLYAILLFTGICSAAYGDNSPYQSNSADAFPILMRTAGTVDVYYGPKRRSGRIAQIGKSAVLRLRKTTETKGCRSGWMERESGGYICRNVLRSTTASAPKPAKIDDPDIREGTKGYLITRGGSKLYKNVRNVDNDHLFIFLYRGSILTGTELTNRYGAEFIRTRQGMWARAENAVQLPEPINRLGIQVSAGEMPPAGMVIEDNVPVYESPKEDSLQIGVLERWSRIDTPYGSPLKVSGNWISLPSGGYARDSSIARIVPPPRKFSLKENEKWISVDRKEQVLVAYEGNRIVRVVPCSTGKRGNTGKGIFRVQLKRRMQTMNLKRGHERVEDVQWVMYYDRDRSIAIHTAYWHRDFGKRMSHGCVNLPRDDARWLYNWATPTSHPEDNENYKHASEAGTRVVVF